MFTLLLSSTSSYTDGWMDVITQYTSLSTHFIFGKLSKLSNILNSTLHTSSSIMNEFLLDMADILVRYPCK